MQETLFTSQGLLICIATQESLWLSYSKADTFIANVIGFDLYHSTNQQTLNWCSDAHLRIMISEDGKSHAFIICSFGSLENRLILGMHDSCTHYLLFWITCTTKRSRWTWDSINCAVIIQSLDLPSERNLLIRTPKVGLLYLSMEIPYNTFSDWLFSHLVSGGRNFISPSCMSYPNLSAIVNIFPLGVMVSWK